MKTEQIPPGLAGYWRDVLVREDGTRIDSGWHRNQIQNSYANILTSFLRRELVFTPEGFMQCAVGSGLVGWDVTSPVQSRGDTTLTTEFFRKALGTVNMTYRDPTTFADVTPTITNVVQMNCTFLPGEATGDHREWGIFGGNATGIADSGFMWNWVVVPVFTKAAGDTLLRSARFIFPIV